MNIYTIHSESHEAFYKIFKDSLFANCKNFMLCSKFAEQVSKTGEYGSDDVIKFYRLKLEYILEVLEKETKPFLYADVDIFVFRDFIADLEPRLGDNDLIAQYEKRELFRTICSGFMYMKPNEKVKKLFRYALRNLDGFREDQKAINHYLRWHPIKWGMLPKTYYQINYDHGNKPWDGEDVNITVKNPFLFHYHWTIGNENRFKLLKMVKNEII